MRKQKQTHNENKKNNKKTYNENRIPDQKNSRFAGFPEGFQIGRTDFPISWIPEISRNVASLIVGKDAMKV